MNLDISDPQFFRVLHDWILENFDEILTWRRKYTPNTPDLLELILEDMKTNPENCDLRCYGLNYVLSSGGNGAIVPIWILKGSCK